MVIFVDEEADPIPKTRSYLALSTNEPLDIHILRRSKGSDAHPRPMRNVVSRVS